MPAIDRGATKGDLRAGVRPLGESEILDGLREGSGVTSVRVTSTACRRSRALREADTAAGAGGIRRGLFTTAVQGGAPSQVAGGSRKWDRHAAGRKKAMIASSAHHNEALEEFGLHLSWSYHPKIGCWCGRRRSGTPGVTSYMKS